MRLERLEISGFKSFSDRSELAFDQGVTAIVGPNGCGKSNVADAITWVLGEQSAKSLRGDKMEDVIFSGSDARKPGGTAEVRLRLTGSARCRRRRRRQPSRRVPPLDGSSMPRRPERQRARQRQRQRERQRSRRTASTDSCADAFTRDVEVTRRLYRSGESEYLIDGEVCRLRDVHELLMDTGLGAKAYAIIEQGKIGMILSSRPADRRQLIEEAAGITKYKSRRRAAELKLEAAQQNLTRIDDIVFEVEKQRGALKRQAAKARRYSRLREELRRWEKVLFARRYRELAPPSRRARGSLADARERETAAPARARRSRSAIWRACASSRPRPTARSAQFAKTRTPASSTSTGGSSSRSSTGSRSRRWTAAAPRSPTRSSDSNARREPARVALESRREAAVDVERTRDEAGAVHGIAPAPSTRRRSRRSKGSKQSRSGAQRGVRGVQCGDGAPPCDRARGCAARARRRDAGKLDVEQDDVRRESEKVEADRAAARGGAAQSQAALERIVARAATRASRSWPTSRSEHE